MGKKKNYEKKTEELIMPILENYKYEFVDAEFVKEAGTWHLRAYIDKEGGITLDDLTVVNHELGGRLDEADFIDEPYILEVSSPGLLRPFKKPADFRRNIGNDVEFRLFSPVTWEENGKKYSDKEFTGILRGYDEENATVTIGFDDREAEFPLRDISLIRKLIDF